MSENYSEYPPPDDETPDLPDAPPTPSATAAGHGPALPFALPRFAEAESRLEPSAAVNEGVDVVVEFGRKMVDPQSDLEAELKCGRVISLDETVDQPVRIKSSGQVIAIGELITQDGAVGVRITELTKPLSN